MTTHHNFLYNSDTNAAPAKVLKQELVTWEETSDGLRIARLIRTFTEETHRDSFSSEHVLLRSLVYANGTAKSKPMEPCDGWGDIWSL